MIIRQFLYRSHFPESTNAWTRLFHMWGSSSPHKKKFRFWNLTDYMKFLDTKLLNCWFSAEFILSYKIWFWFLGTFQMWSREMFDKWQAQRWWGENFDRIMELYNVQKFNQQALDTPSRSECGVNYFLLPTFISLVSALLDFFFVWTATCPESQNSSHITKIHMFWYENPSPMRKEISLSWLIITTMTKSTFAHFPVSPTEYEGKVYFLLSWSDIHIVILVSPLPA